MGFSHKEAVTLLYAISGLLGLVAVIYTGATHNKGSMWRTVIISAAAVGILLLIFLCMRKPSTRILSGLAEHVSEIELEARAEERAEAKKAEAEADKIKHDQKLANKKHHK